MAKIEYELNQVEKEYDKVEYGTPEFEIVLEKLKQTRNEFSESVREFREKYDNKGIKKLEIFKKEYSKEKMKLESEDK